MRILNFPAGRRKRGGTKWIEVDRVSSRTGRIAYRVFVGDEASYTGKGAKNV